MLRQLCVRLRDWLRGLLLQALFGTRRRVAPVASVITRNPHRMRKIAFRFRRLSDLTWRKSAGAARATYLGDQILETGFEPFCRSEPLPPIRFDEIELACWLAPSPEADEPGLVCSGQIGAEMPMAFSQIASCGDRDSSMNSLTQNAPRGVRPGVRQTDGCGRK